MTRFARRSARGRRARGWVRPLALLGLLASAGCMAGASAGPVPTTATDPDDPIPAGYGTLRQDDITLELVDGPVRVRITPLESSLIRLTAPDTEQRLRALRERAGSDGAVWFLVSVQTEAPGGADFDPMAVEAASVGIPQRPAEVRGLTPQWGSGRLEQRVPQQALYRFPGDIDPWRSLEVRVGEMRSRSWTDRLPSLDAERARVRARAGGGYWSSPNFLILR